MLRTMLMLSVTLGWLGVASIPIESTWAQESESSGQGRAAELAQGVEKIQKDFAKHLEKRTSLEEKYEELQSQLKQTEEELKRVNVEGMRQQLAAMQSAMQSMQLNARLQMISGAGGSAGGAIADPALRGLAQQQLLQNRFMQDLNTTLRSEELRRLDADSQGIIRRRIEAVQSAVSLQQEWAQLQSEGSRFFERYWTYSDPEFSFSEDEAAAVLQMLEQGSDEDVAARLAQALLLASEQQHAESLASLEDLLKTESPLNGVAMMAKAWTLTSLKKDREAKQSLQTALKWDKANPYVRWVRSLIAADQEQWSIAESEWKFLTTIKPMEKEARRKLALLYVSRAKKSPGEGNKALKEAQLAMDLETDPSWYSHYVMGLAYSAARKKDDAMKAMKQAESLAEGSPRERCQKALELIEQAP